VLGKAGGRHKWLVADDDLQAWLRARESELPKGALHGEVLTSKQVVQRYGISKDIVREAILSGLLPASRERDRGGRRLFLVGSLDVEAFLRDREKARVESWICPCIAKVTGIPVQALHVALQKGRLRYRDSKEPFHGSNRQLEEDVLLQWLQHEAPPYRKEVAHLSALADVEEVARLAKIPVEQVQACVQAGELVTLGGFVPRRILDRWLMKRRLPPSWKRDDTEWLRTIDVARTLGVSLTQVHRRIKLGYLEAQRVGHRVLVRREAVQKLAESAPPDCLTLQEAATRYQVPKHRLVRAVRGGFIRHIRIPRMRTIHVLPRDVESWLRRPVAMPPRVKENVPVPSLIDATYSLAASARLGRVAYETARSAAKAGRLKARFTPAGVYSIAREDLQAWLVALAGLRAKAREAAQRNAPPKSLQPVPATGQPSVLRGEVLNIERACQRYGCHYHVLVSAVESGLLPAAKEYHEGKHHWQLGNIDVENFLREHPEEERLWISKSIAEVTGISQREVFRAISTGQLASDRTGRVTSIDLAGWLETAPAYRWEVECLSRMLSSKEAGKVSKLGQTAVVKAIRAGELQALAIEASTGTRYCIPRRCFDVWLLGQGLPPSWHLDKPESEHPSRPRA